MNKIWIFTGILVFANIVLYSLSNGDKDWRLAEIEKDRYVERFKLKAESIKCEYRYIAQQALDCNGLDANNKYVDFECNAKSCWRYCSVK